MNTPEKELLGYKNIIEEYLKKQKHLLSSYSFINIFLWHDFFDFEFKVIEQNLCVFAKNEIGCFLYLPPIGTHIAASSLEASFEHMRSINGFNGVSRIENVEEKDLQYFPEERFTFFNKASEYIYLKEDIAGLKGNRFKSKRNSYNHFIKSYPYEFADFDISMSEGCSCLYAAWADKKKRKMSDDVYFTMIEENRAVHALAFKYFKELDLIGRVVFINNEIKAYTFGYELNEDIFCVLFEVADEDIKGLPVFIFSKFCGDTALGSYKYINVMDDFGMENVKRTKLSFNPNIIIPSFTVNEGKRK